jgi:hypothetical protein
MVGKCANKCCLTPRHPNEGKVFRLDIDLGNKAGGSEHKTAYIWLCANCATKMHPKVQVIGNTIQLLLSKNDPTRMAETDVAVERVN